MVQYLVTHNIQNGKIVYIFLVHLVKQELSTKILLEASLFSYRLLSQQRYNR